MWHKSQMNEENTHGSVNEWPRYPSKMTYCMSPPRIESGISRVQDTCLDHCFFSIYKFYFTDWLVSDSRWSIMSSISQSTAHRILWTITESVSCGAGAMATYLVSYSELQLLRVWAVPQYSSRWGPRPNSSKKLPHLNCLKILEKRISNLNLGVVGGFFPPLCALNVRTHSSWGKMSS